VDVRIISATDKDLKTHLREGLIREDFFYRIRVLVITLPPLRERREDIPLLKEEQMELHLV
jgi:transcriptional regulator with PAS, ATPase and Fis domain